MLRNLSASTAAGTREGKLGNAASTLHAVEIAEPGARHTSAEVKK